MGKTFDLRVHLAIEHGGRVVSPKTVTAGGLNVPMRHHWAGVWSGPENFILENMQEVVVAASASTNVGDPGKIQLDGSLVVSRGSKVEFKRCDIGSFCDVTNQVIVAKFMNITDASQFVVGTQMSLTCHSISVGESPSTGESEIAVTGGKPMTIEGDFLAIHSGSKVDGTSGGYQVKRKKSNPAQTYWDDTHGYGQGPGSYETHSSGGRRTETNDENGRLGYGGSHGGVGGYMYIWRTQARHMTLQRRRPSNW